MDKKSTIFKNNLLFYTILKLLIKLQLKEKKILILKELLLSKKITETITVSKFKEFWLFKFLRGMALQTK